MKFLHIGDLHIGKSLGDFDLIDDQQYILDEILEIAAEENIDAVLIAGDVYDKPIPSEAAVRTLDQFLRRLTEQKRKIFMISGNHDSDERLNFGSSFFESNGLYIAAKYNGELYKRTLTDAYGIINLYLMPFVKASQVRHFFPDEKIETYEDAINAVLAHAEIDPKERNVILAHQFVIGGEEEPTLAGSEGLTVQNVGTVEKISASVFSKFDYTALGHIHSAQCVGKENVRYSGSPLKYSLSEAGHRKSIPIINIEEKGTISITCRALQPKRDLRHIKGPIEMLLKKENVTAPEDFIYATLTDEDVIVDAMGIFQQTYPNTVRIDYDNSRIKELERIDMEEITQGKSFSDMIAEFYHKMYGCEISEEELELMETIARKAGAADETN